MADIITGDIVQCSETGQQYKALYYTKSYCWYCISLDELYILPAAIHRDRLELVSRFVPKEHFSPGDLVTFSPTAWLAYERQLYPGSYYVALDYLKKKKSPQMIVNSISLDRIYLYVSDETTKNYPLIAWLAQQEVKHQTITHHRI